MAEMKTGPMQAVPEALGGAGTWGDRYAAKASTFTPRSGKLRGYDLTLIEGEVLGRRGHVPASLASRGALGTMVPGGTIRCKMHTLL